MKLRNAKELWMLCFAIFFITCSATDNQAEIDNSIINIQSIDSLKIINEFFIQEKQQALTEISHTAFSPDGKLMSISDIGGYSCFIISALTGEIYDVIKSHYSMMDSVAMYANFGDSNNVRIVTIQNLINSAKEKKQKINVAQISSQLSTTVFSTAFLSNNQIIGNGLTPVLLEQGQGDNPLRGTANLPTIFQYSLNDKKITNFRPYDIEAYNNGVSPFDGNIMFKYPDTVIAPYADRFNMKEHRYNEIKTIGFFNLNGKKLSTTLSLPKEYAEYQLDYNFYNLYSCEGENSHIYAVNSIIPRVFDASTGKSFEMKNIPSYANNKAFFSKSSEKTISQDSLLRYHKFSIVGLYSKHTPSLMLIGFWKNQADTLDKSNNTWFVQEYSVDGRLIEMRVLPTKESNDRGKVQWISYSKKNNAVYVFYLSKQNGWKVTAYQWRA